jgi:hypothetical protein
MMVTHHTGATPLDKGRDVVHVVTDRATDANKWRSDPFPSPPPQRRRGQVELFGSFALSHKTTHAYVR